MDVLPFATTSSSFSDAIIHRFRLRPVTVTSTGPNAAFAPGKEEAVFDFRFNPPASQGSSGPILQEGTCCLPSGEKIRFNMNDEKGSLGGGIHVFAGLRSDPFFIDFEAMLETLKNGRLAFLKVGTLFGPGANALSIVLAIDSAALPGTAGGKLFAAACETVADGKLEIRLERVGRPEIKNVLLSMKQHDTVNRDIELRDLYNLEDAFHVGPDYRGAYRARMNANLAFIDHLDGVTHWPLSAEGPHPLTELLLADFLVVDVSKPYSENSYFEIERAMLEGRAHKTCGGRLLNDDVMDTLYTLYVNRGNGPRISDGVDQATVPASRTFPYLAPPNPSGPRPKAAILGGGQEPVQVDPSDHQHHKFGRFQL
jgi:hypothetical protein